MNSYLQNVLDHNTLCHAYLFYGPKDSEKQAEAFWFAESILCEGRIKKPCHTCSPCRQFKSRVYPDFFLLAPSEGKNVISIDQIREFKAKLSLDRFLNSYKVAIIEKAHTLTIPAFNALLKLLEEPTEKTVIILIADSIAQLPPTILSRVLKIKFARRGVTDQTPSYTLAQGFLQSDFEERLMYAERIAGEDRGYVDEVLCNVMAILQNSLREKLYDAPRLCVLIKKIYMLRRSLSQNVNVRLNLEAISLMMT